MESTFCFVLECCKAVRCSRRGEKGPKSPRDKKKARSVVGRRKKSLLCDPAPELRPYVGLGDRGKKGEDIKQDGRKKEGL